MTGPCLGLKHASLKRDQTRLELRVWVSGTDWAHISYSICKSSPGECVGGWGGLEFSRKAKDFIDQGNHHAFLEINPITKTLSFI